MPELHPLVLDRAPAKLGATINQGLRVRAAGVMIRDGHVLMESLRGAEQWSPIGGGVEPGELIEEAVVREFEEEIGWNVAVQRIALVTDDIFPSG